MVYTLEGFCSAACSDLRRDSGVEGRERVARHLERLLVDANFVRDYLGPDKRSGVETVYIDEEFGPRVMAHTNRSASNNTPHCHGPSWVIYGMAMNFVEMRLNGSVGMTARKMAAQIFSSKENIA